MVKAQDNVIACFKDQGSAYQLRDEKQSEFPNSCHVHVQKHVVFEDYEDRESRRA